MTFNFNQRHELCISFHSKMMLCDVTYWFDKERIISQLKNEWAFPVWSITVTHNPLYCIELYWIAIIGFYIIIFFLLFALNDASDNLISQQTVEIPIFGIRTRSLLTIHLRTCYWFMELNDGNEKQLLRMNHWVPKGAHNFCAKSKWNGKMGKFLLN